MSFAPALTVKGEPCKSCASMGELCAKHNDAPLTSQRLKKGLWRASYLSALRKGFSKRSAAGLAQVTSNTVFRHQREDPEFADKVQVAFDQGTAHLEAIAYDRITDENHPSDSILKHLLAFRGIQAKTHVEVTGPGGGPIETRPTIPFDLLSPSLKVRIIEELEAIEKGEPLQIEAAEVLPEGVPLIVEGGTPSESENA